MMKLILLICLCIVVTQASNLHQDFKQLIRPRTQCCGSEQRNEILTRLAVLRREMNQMFTMNSFDVKFPRRSSTDYVIHRGVPSMRAVTVCFWVKTADKKTGTLVSYAVPSSTNEIIIEKHKSFYFNIGGSYVGTGVAANDVKWHHICATWENTAGSWVLYKDGQAAANGNGLSKGHLIPGGGSLVLGQDQDSVGGGFQSHQCFVGELTGVNLWSRVLVPSEIAKLSAVCAAGDGDVLKWRDVIAGIRGRTQVMRPSSCME